MRWGVEKVKVDEIIDAEGFEQEDNIPQVHTLNLGHWVLFELVLVGPGCVQSRIVVLTI